MATRYILLCMQVFQVPEALAMNYRHGESNRRTERPDKKHPKLPTNQMPTEQPLQKYQRQRQFVTRMAESKAGHRW